MIGYAELKSTEFIVFELLRVTFRVIALRTLISIDCI